jgi:hypothetical protein
MATREVLQVLADADSDLLGMMKLDQLSQSSAQDRLMDVAKLKLEGTTKLLEKHYDSADAAVAKMEDAIIADEFNIDDTQGANYRMYKDAWRRRADAFTDWANAIEYPVYNSENDIISLVDNIFETTVADVKDPRSKLKWGDKDGGWAEFISRASPGVNLDLVEIVWNDRYSKLKGGGITAGVEGPTGEFGYTTDVYGGSYTPERIEMGGPWWLDSMANWWKDLSIRSDIRDQRVRENLPRILETTKEREGRLGGGKSPTLSQYEEAATRRQQAKQPLIAAQTGLLSDMLAGVTGSSSAQASGGVSPYDRTGQAAVIARNAAQDLTPMMGQEGLINGFFAKQKEEDAGLKITKKAMDFLQRLAQMIEQEGAEDAFRLMSAEFQQLEKSDKQQIEDYLQKQQA